MQLEIHSHTQHNIKYILITIKCIQINIKYKQININSQPTTGVAPSWHVAPEVTSVSLAHTRYI